MQLVLLALAAAFFPTVLAAVVILLSQPRRLPLLSAYLAGGMTISIGLGLGIVAALKASHTLHTSKSALSWTADLAIGGLALLLAVALARAPTSACGIAETRTPARRMPDSVSRGRAHPGSAPCRSSRRRPGDQRARPPYLIALKDIAAGHHSTGVDIFQVLLFNLIMFLLVEVPLLGLIFAPERTRAVVASMDHWLSANSRRIAMIVAALLGAFLIARGIAHS